MRTTKLTAVLFQFDVMKLNTGINYATNTFDKCVPYMFGINKVNNHSDPSLVLTEHDDNNGSKK